NAAKAEAEVTGQPNLSFAESSGTFDEAARRAAVSFCVVNSGQASSGETGLSIQDSLDGQSAGNLKVGALSTGGRACFNDIEVPVPAEFSGTRQYALTADPQNAVAESDESDNTRMVSLVVPEAASPMDKALKAVREILQSR